MLKRLFFSKNVLVLFFVLFSELLHYYVTGANNRIPGPNLLQTESYRSILTLLVTEGITYSLKLKDLLLGTQHKPVETYTLLSGLNQLRFYASYIYTYFTKTPVLPYTPITYPSYTSYHSVIPTKGINDVSIGCLVLPFTFLTYLLHCILPMLLLLRYARTMLQDLLYKEGYIYYVTQRALRLVIQRIAKILTVLYITAYAVLFKNLLPYAYVVGLRYRIPYLTYAICPYVTAKAPTIWVLVPCVLMANLLLNHKHHITFTNHVHKSAILYELLNILFYILSYNLIATNYYILYGVNKSMSLKHMYQLDTIYNWEQKQRMLASYTTCLYYTIYYLKPKFIHVVGAISILYTDIILSPALTTNLNI